MRVGVVVFPGSNCDRDMYHVLTDVFDLDATYCWHEHGLPKDVDAIVLPGGFSYGDRLRAGAIAAHSPVIADVKRMAEASVPVLGVCNGFQILVEAGLLPGALLKNDSLSFMCEWTELLVQNNKTPFTSKFSKNQRIPIPIANGEGRYYADEDTLREMERNGQIVFKYGDRVNGSSGMIAGVCNPEGNVVGMMPHPERAAEPEINPTGRGTTSLMFESLRAGAAS
ncbi:MAG: phosphoribosylformylglycinamidine synthase subunit PurQ [Nitrosopumilus sp. H8]|nr:MAG: phosphoribosylformylglycinamidine synthase subunit PurQ [Nitrosopumilus sp. H13]RNJ79968.1 MAG: phosphoribosylformylglycinamidine synthase subunit PurQ [Nitrosopumilus sp. H8]